MSLAMGASEVRLKIGILRQLQEVGSTSSISMLLGIKHWLSETKVTKRAMKSILCQRKTSEELESLVRILAHCCKVFY